MPTIQKIPIPTNSLLERLSTNGAYADCYTTEFNGRVTFADYIFAFYTTPLFRIERLLLATMVSKSSTDADARQLADNLTDKFAAWTVEARTENELLLCDMLSRTRSWLMVKENGLGTQLYFGSAVVRKEGERSLGVVFHALLGFHQIYSVLLLRFATARLNHQKGVTP